MLKVYFFAVLVKKIMQCFLKFLFRAYDTFSYENYDKYLPCLSASECIDTNALMAGYVILEIDASRPAAHIILKI